MTLRICILETDILRPQLIDQYQGYGRMFEQLFEKQSIPAQFDVFNVVEGRYPEDGQAYDAYLVTGSKADSFGSDPWIMQLREYLLQRYENGDRLLGICFGHQLLALLLGGKTERAAQGWGIGVNRYQLLEQPEWMSPPLENLDLLVFHQDQVVELPENATLLASSEFCPNAAYRIGDQVLCFQAHPEFVDDYERALLDLRREFLGEALCAEAMRSMAMQHHGVVVAEWMLRFVTQEKAQNRLAA
ncbi:GMP synthase-Glutamine amidotransferase [Pseudomonas pohangensis]|jgi:GMP synthase-like glutamine amidotransferase|uniref:GMP synthase-Glutamine amidotransferase n=1 Tax=Pseudomonas pohangensis TaxID=364197 RepID=A0A1H2EX54_9PSED|nr:amidotransferase [Pseudomonas pohangensis]SDT99553.1 GMP synthase-Glutamine amidotransferase [Pseudomonas pohangensis]